MLTALLDEARAAGLPAAVMTFEPHPREYFAPATAPARLSSLREKCEMFEHLGVDEVIVCRFNDALAALEPEAFVRDFLGHQLQTRYLLIGDDFRFGRGRKGDWDLICRLAPELDMQVRAMHSVMEDGERISSTAVRSALQAGQLAEAARLLGRPYSISGTVVHGNKIGRTLGFPTANVQLQHNLPPLLGIYAVTVSGVADRPWPGAASVGFRPTIGDELAATLEVHLLDFAGDIYGAHVHVDFLHKLRDEEKYADLAALTAQIAQDIEDTRAWFARLPESCTP